MKQAIEAGADTSDHQLMNYSSSKNAQLLEPTFHSLKNVRLPEAPNTAVVLQIHEFLSPENRDLLQVVGPYLSSKKRWLVVVEHWLKEVVGLFPIDFLLIFLATRSHCLPDSNFRKFKSDVTVHGGPSRTLLEVPPEAFTISTQKGYRYPKNHHWKVIASWGLVEHVAGTFETPCEVLKKYVMWDPRNTLRGLPKQVAETRKTP